MEFHSHVLFGVPDEVISSLDDLNDGWATNKFGGTPNWIQDTSIEYPQCNLCNAFLPLVTQICCPLENSFFHRVLYIFGCTNISCWNKNESWKVFRCQLRVENVQEAKAPKIQEKDSWCEEADEWGEEDNETPEIDNSSMEQLEQRTKGLNLSDTMATNGASKKDVQYSEKSGKQFKKLVKFVPYYISVIEKSQLLSEANAPSRYEKKLLAEYQKREGLGDIEAMMEAGAEQGWGNEKYEQSVAKHGDKIFQKFQKQLRLCPKQCLRYSRNGDPLLMSSRQTLGEIPPCSSCGQRRVFEIQLMPALVLLLRSNRKSCPEHLSVEQTMDNNDRMDGGDSVGNHRDQCSQSDTEQCGEEAFSGSQNIEFGTIFVYTCSQSCWSDDVKFREEYVVVHSDPDQHLFR